MIPHCKIKRGKSRLDLLGICELLRSTRELRAPAKFILQGWAVPGLARLVHRLCFLRRLGADSVWAEGGKCLASPVTDFATSLATRRAKVLHSEYREQVCIFHKASTKGLKL